MVTSWGRWLTWRSIAPRCLVHSRINPRIAPGDARDGTGHGSRFTGRRSIANLPGPD
jgi:hypothetical protein